MDETRENWMKKERAVRYTLTGLLLTLLCFGASFVFCFDFGLGKDVFGAGWLLASSRIAIAFLSTLAAASIFAAELLKSRRYFWALFPALGFAVPALISYTAYAVVLWVLFAVSAALVYVFLRKKQSRLPLVFALFLCVFLALLSCFLLYYQTSFGAPSVEGVVGLVQERTKDFSTRMRELLLAQESLTEELRTVIGGEEFSNSLFLMLLTSTPGILLAASFFAAYFATFVVYLWGRRDLMTMLYEGDGFAPNPSIVTAILFAVCLVSESVLLANLTLAMQAVLTAFLSVFQVLFCFVGLHFFFARFKRRHPFTKRTWPIVLIAVGAIVLYTLVVGIEYLLMIAQMFFTFFVFALYPISYVYGLFRTIYTYVRTRKNSSGR